MKKFDNIFDKNYENKIEKLFLGKNFPWYFHTTTVPYSYTLEEKKLKDKNTLDTPQLTHLFYDNSINSNYFHFINELFEKFTKKIEFNKKYQFYKIKANLNTNISFNTKLNYQFKHRDNENNDYLSFLYYVNNCDGNTHFFENNKKIKSFNPKKGRFLSFNSNQLHCGSNPIKSKYRIVINYVIKLL
jgi:hypothetical protein